MDSTTRVMTTLQHRRPDRVGRFDSYWPEFEAAIRQRIDIDARKSIDEYFQMDIGIACPDETVYPSGRRTVFENETEIRFVNGWGMTARVRKGAAFEEEIGAAFEDREGFEQSAPFEDPTSDARYADFVQDVARMKQRGLCVFGKIGGLYIRSAFICGTENYMYQIAADPGFVAMLAERLEAQQTEIALQELERGDLYDTGIWIYDDIASNLSPIMSPKTFEKIYYPCYKRLIAKIKKAGAKRVLLHSDGNVAPLLDAFIDAGIDGINPVEPKAGMDIPSLKKIYGDRLSYVGGMCNSHTLVRGTLAEIEAQARAILECAEDGGVVIGSHSIGPDVPLESYLHYIKIVEKYGCFS